MFKQFNLQPKYIYLIGILFLVVASIFSTGYHHYDEHFQILEFAGLKLGLTTAENLPWEYHYQMRPSLQPTMAVVIYRFLGFLGIDNPFIVTFLLRLLSGGLAFWTTLLLYRVYKNKISDTLLKRWFLILSFTLWFFIYSGVRFSSENWSGLLFIIGFAYYFLLQKRNFLSFLAIGALLGLSFLFRYQTAFLTFGFTLWLLIIQKEQFTNIAKIVIGFLSIALIGVLIDTWFYGEWTITTWNYFTQNIIEDKVSGFGVDPWWYYLTKSFEQGVYPISLLFIVSFFVVAIFKPKSPIIWSVIPFLLIHNIIGHKELRFLFPIILFIPIVIIKGIQIIQDKYVQNLSANKYLKGYMKLVFMANAVLLLIIMFKPADNQISLYQKLYSNYKEPTTLYYLERNPYHRVLDINFYKRKNLSLVPITSIDDIPESKKSLVVMEHRDESNNPRLGKMVFSTFPDWLLKFNFNNWQSRSRAWFIYEVHKDELGNTKNK